MAGGARRGSATPWRGAATRVSRSRSSSIPTPSKSRPPSSWARPRSSCTPAVMPTPPTEPIVPASWPRSGPRPPLAVTSGLELHAGHGLNYQNVAPVARLDQMEELNIGHSIVSRAVFVGLKQAVHEMKACINLAVGRLDQSWNFESDS